MKVLKYILPVVFTLLFIACDNDDDNPTIPVSEVAGLKLAQEISSNTHLIEIYTKDGDFMQGYNEITIRLKDIASDTYVKDASFDWKPEMHMHMGATSHACPKSDLLKVEDKNEVYSGFIIFQMPTVDHGEWHLHIHYTIEGKEFELGGDIEVKKSDKQMVSVFTGSDDVKYVLALIEPQDPDVKINDIAMALFKMESMMSFPVVENYKIKLDPRMPSMGGHSSPNNEDLVYNSHKKMYEGKVSFTMTGYWQLNLMLLDEDQKVLKGEAITSENDSSSLYLEIEF